MTTHGVSRPYAGEGCGAGVGWVRQRWARGVGAGEKWCMSGCRRGAWARGRGWRVWVGMGAGRGRGPWARGVGAGRGRGAWVYWGVGAGRGRGTWARGVGAGIDVEEDEALVLELLCWPLMMDWASLVLGGHWLVVGVGASRSGPGRAQLRRAPSQSQLHLPQHRTRAAVARPCRVCLCTRVRAPSQKGSARVFRWVPMHGQGLRVRAHPSTLPQPHRSLTAAHHTRSTLTSCACR